MNYDAIIQNIKMYLFGMMSFNVPDNLLSPF